MTKCDFCTDYIPNKGCRWTLDSLREGECEKAIRRMTQTFLLCSTRPPQSEDTVQQLLQFIEGD